MPLPVLAAKTLSVTVALTVPVLDAIDGRVYSPVVPAFFGVDSSKAADLGRRKPPSWKPGEGEPRRASAICQRGGSRTPKSRDKVF
jgi:hypothetical protein